MYTVGATAAASDRDGAVDALVFGLLVFEWAGWYFFGNPNGTEYYDALPKSDAGAGKRSTSAT